MTLRHAVVVGPSRIVHLSVDVVTVVCLLIHIWSTIYLGDSSWITRLGWILLAMLRLSSSHLLIEILHGLWELSRLLLLVLQATNWHDWILLLLLLLG